MQILILSRFGTASYSSFNLCTFMILKLLYPIQLYLTFGSAKPTGQCHD